MLNTPIRSPQAQPEMEASLADVELRLASLGEALRERDALAIETHAQELHGALIRAVDHFARAARSGPLPPELRSRLIQANGAVAVQRQSLARATAALGRALDVLMPGDHARPYSPLGTADRGKRSGVIQA